jgi:hypothetical protein
MDLTDAQWAFLESQFRPQRRKDGRGRPWQDTRAVLNGVLWSYARVLPGTICLLAIRLIKPVIDASNSGSAPGCSSGCCKHWPKTYATAGSWI